LWHGRPLKKAKNGVHLNLGGHHRLKRWHQEGVLPGRLLRVCYSTRIKGRNMQVGYFAKGCGDTAYAKA
jgi:hypothetical protein